MICVNLGFHWCQLFCELQDFEKERLHSPEFRLLVDCVLFMNSRGFWMHTKDGCHAALL